MKTIKLTNVGKKFIGQKLKAEFWALRDVNIEFENGKASGIIGRNGAGKTTLLNVLAGVSKATIGSLEVRGRLASLLTLGAGFQDELSGRENIYLNSSILGMSRDEINRKYRSIVEFSELSSFLDFPLKTFSQGMRLRLGFSVAVHMDFDILLIDEILSVGDISFQKKCFEKIEEFKNKGKTMIIATQALDIIERICDKVFILEEGRVIFEGLSAEAVDRYRKLLNERSFCQRRRSESLITRTKRWAEDTDYWGQKENSGKVLIESVKIFDKWGRQANKFKSRQRIKIKVYFYSHHSVKDVHFGVALFREDGVYCYGPNTRWDGHYIDIQPGKGWFSLEYKDFLLAPGTYYLSVAIWDKDETSVYDYHRGCYKIEIIGKNLDGRLLNLPFCWRPKSRLPVLKFSKPSHSISIKGLVNKERDIKQEKRFKIEEIKFFDKGQKPKDTFVSGEEMAVRVFLGWKEKHPAKNLEVWIGIFRSDGIYCQGASKKINFKDKEIILSYFRLRLLPGVYSVSAGVWDSERKEFIANHHRLYSFKVAFIKKDHGTVYLEHKWKWKLPREG